MSIPLEGVTQSTVWYNQDCLGHQIALLTRAGESAPITVSSNGVDLANSESKARPRDKNTVVFADKMSYHAIAE
jgi:hypothetical protein